MLNQPQPVFSYTIPYYITADGESIELFVSEKTYETYVTLSTSKPVFILKGNLHPLDPELGTTTSTLVDATKHIVLIGTKDLDEYTNEMLDMVIANEFERILAFEERSFFRYLYKENTPEHIQIFIDDIQQTMEEIPLAKRLLKKGYRIIEREQEIINSLIENKNVYEYTKKKSPYEQKESLFLFHKLFFVYHLDRSLYKQVKQQIQPIYPLLFSEHEKLQKLIHKYSFVSTHGRQRALEKLLRHMNYQRYVNKVTLSDIPVWELPPHIQKKDA